MLLAVVAAGSASCSREDAAPRGKLVLGISTNLEAPRDLNRVGLEVVSEDGKVVEALELEISPSGDVPLPTTVDIVPAKAGQTLRIDVSAMQQDEVRVVRRAIVKVPTDRAALLQMPLSWLCDFSLSGGGARDCADDETCKAGVCVSAEVDADALPDYAPGLVFGGGDERGDGSRCLDVRHCFSRALTLAKPSVDDCSLSLPDGADADALNVALVLPPMTDGHCLDDSATGDESSGACFLPLDFDPVEGFWLKAGRIELPSAACQRRSVNAIAVSTSCPTKDLSTPICGPWTGWGMPPDEPSNGEGGGAGTAQLGGGTGAGAGEEGVGGAGAVGAGVAGAGGVDGGEAGSPAADGEGGAGAEPTGCAADCGPTTAGCSQLTDDDELAGTWSALNGAQPWTLRFSNGATTWIGAHQKCTGPYAADGSFQLNCVTTDSSGLPALDELGTCRVDAGALACDFSWSIDGGESGQSSLTGARQTFLQALEGKWRNCGSCDWSFDDQGQGTYSCDDGESGTLLVAADGSTTTEGVGVGGVGTLSGQGTVTFATCGDSLIWDYTYQQPAHEGPLMSSSCGVTRVEP